MASQIRPCEQGMVLECLDELSCWTESDPFWLCNKTVVDTFQLVLEMVEDMGSCTNVIYTTVAHVLRRASSRNRT